MKMQKKFLTLALLLAAATAATAQTVDVTMDGGWSTTNSRYEYSGTFNQPAYDVEVTTELYYKLSATETNSDDIKAKTDVFIDRTLVNDDCWYTFCAPFSTAIPTEWTVKEFTGSGYDADTQTLTLNFGNAASIAAGTPYLVKVSETVDGPTFEGVTQDWTANPVTPTNADGPVTFVPVLTPTELTANDRTKLFLGAENKLYYPSANVTVNGFRAYFQLNGLTAGDLTGGGARTFVLNFDGEQTGILSTTNLSNYTNSGAWFTLDGRKVQNTTRKGVYIQNGRKVVIK